MNFAAIILIVLFGLIGGLSSLYCFISVFGVIGYKFYRKLKFKISMFD